METGTAIGLLVGGAVLLLATRAPQPAAINPATGQPYPSALSQLNPLNWFGGAQAQQQPAAPNYLQQNYQPPANQGGFQNIGYSPNGYSPQGYSPSVSPGGYTPGGNAYQTTANTDYGAPIGGFQNANYASSPYGGYSAGGFQQAAYSSPYGGSPQYSYA